jgi:para-aminobenzoate synthetase/4-amino-4-deoxychorismate lyase
MRRWRVSTPPSSAGDLYQVNYTAQMHGVLRHAGAVDAASCGPALFAALQRATTRRLRGLSGYRRVRTDPLGFAELFFDWRDGALLARPMKGTAPRGNTPQDDARRAAGLRASPKERAENVMIVDLLRNDMSRVALPHSVQVQRLFHTQALPSVWQMTTDVLARTRPECTLWDVLAALFPCGSVTGAPKVQAMRMIHALEPEARGVYCGALGVLRPGGAATFNVPIRTVTLRADTAGGVQARCGIGSGITFDAQPQGEWQEWQHKQAFVQRASTPFELLETLRLQDGLTLRRDAHLARMRLAAAHFGMPWDAARLHAALDALALQYPQGNWRVRLLLDARGQVRCEAFALPADPPQVRLQPADRPFAMAHSEFTRFKTTRRAHYDAFAPRTPPCSTPFCGTKTAASPNARAATSPCCATASGPRRPHPAACWPVWAVRLFWSRAASPRA